MSNRRLWATGVLCALLVGCAPKPFEPPPATAIEKTSNTTQLTTTAAAVYEPGLYATLAPPAGWRLDVKAPDKPNVKHYVWISPSGHTAFGVMKFSLPIPSPHDPVLWIFLSEMRRSEGAANLISKVTDRNLRGIRFVAEGGRYRIRTNFTIRGLTGWMAYAGTLLEKPVDEQELDQAVAARESVKFGRPE